MKLSLRSLIALSLAFGGISAAQESARLKIATVDMQTLFKDYGPTKTVLSQFEKEKETVTKQALERKNRLDEAKLELDTLQKQLSDPSIADAKKQTLYTELQVKKQQGEALQREAEEFIARKQRALQEQLDIRIKEILKGIRTKVQTYAESQNYDYVLDKTGTSASQVPVLLYTKDATDITDALTKELQQDAPAEEAPAPPEEKK